MTKRILAPITAFAVASLLLFALALATPPTAHASSGLSFKVTADIKNTGSLTTYPGKKTTLALKGYAAGSAEVSWKTTKAAVAKVSKKGVVTAVRPGCCYVKATVGGKSTSLLVEVTSKQAYQAVQNAFIDKNTKIAYSQAKRMKKSYRDCSSFVSRCYWDSSLRRKIFAIGGSEGKSWALPAADQAKWLKKRGKAVSEGPCSIEKLRPGDTLYFETDYAGKDKSQWRYIDHAAIYVGNGYVMDTGGRGGKGTIGFRWCKYSAKDKTIKLIGRPCP